MRYMVIRSDDNGHTFLIQNDLTESDANALYKRVLTGHKQMYEIICYDPNDFHQIIKDRDIRF